MTDIRIDIEHPQFNDLKRLIAKDKLPLTLIQMVEEANRMGAIVQTGYAIAKELIPYVVLWQQFHKKENDKEFESKREYEVFKLNPEKEVEPEKPKSGKGYKQCPSCSEQVRSFAKVCECGHEFNKKPELAGV